MMKTIANMFMAKTLKTNQIVLTAILMKWVGNGLFDFALYKHLLSKIHNGIIFYIFHYTMDLLIVYALFEAYKKPYMRLPLIGFSIYSLIRIGLYLSLWNVIDKDVYRAVVEDKYVYFIEWSILISLGLISMLWQRLSANG